MKTRLTSVDIRCIVAELRQRIISLRLANVYDMDRKNYLLKFAKPDAKVYVMVESGVRLHTTKFEREKNQFPNQFSIKLRKHLRTRRCEDVQQLGMDRVIDFTFGMGEAAYHLIMEFYAKGNIVLTDHTYRILALLRVHRKEEDTRMAVGEVYPVGTRKSFSRITPDALQAALTKIAAANANATLKTALNTQFDYGAGFVEHCVRRAGLKSNTKLSTLTRLPDGAFEGAIVDSLVQEFGYADDFIEKCKEEPQHGFIVLRQDKTSAQEEKEKEGKDKEQPSDGLTPAQREDLQKQKRYDEFTPFLFHQFQDHDCIKMESFGHCVDKFFSAIESQQLDRKKTNIEKGYTSKVDKARREQQQRIQSLDSEARKLERRAILIQDNVELVDRAIEIINSAIAQSLDWDAIWDVILEQKQHGDLIANMIYKLKLDRNTVTLLLRSKYDDDIVETDSSNHEQGEDADGDEDADEDEKVRKRHKHIGDSGEALEKVDVDLALTAFSNVAQYFENKKKVQHKLDKTLEASERVLKIAEKKSERNLEKNQIKAEINLMRKRLWFEKFNWFISSENFLVISGRDAQQNEMIVKRYMQKGDIYVHAEIHGAASCVIKNSTGKPVPHLTLSEAGTMCVCRSAAWDSKIMTSAYWVYDHQVSKTAPTGEYLTTGSFMIRGKKNFLAPSQLVVGLAVLFRVDETCIANHIGERKPRQEIEEEEEGEEVNAEKDTIEFDYEESKPKKILSKAQKRKEKRRARTQQQKGEAEEVAEKEIESPIPTEPSQEQQPRSDRQHWKRPPIEHLIEEKLTGVKEEEWRSPSPQQGRKKDKLSGEERKKLKELVKKGASRAEAMEIVMNQKKVKDEDQSQEKQEQTDIPDDGSVSETPNGVGNDEESIITPSDNTEEQDQKTKGKKREVSKRQRRRQEEEEIATIMEEENIKVLDTATLQQLNMELDSLTGQPLDEDIITFAIPVCAPYNTLKNYRYKVKLVPGSQKRGKAGQQAMYIIAQEAKRESSEKEYLTIKAIAESDVTSAMIGSCRVSSGAQPPKNKNNSKKNKNKKKK